MKNKIVAIGGGENGRVLKDGTYAPYNTAIIDKEIIKLSGKKNPNFLFINHAMPSLDVQDSYFQTMKKIYGDLYNCSCDDLKTNELEKHDIVMKKIDWADIIYEGGGDTNYMINLWKNTGFDKTLYNAWQSGKVISGISAGAICWFNSGNSDSAIEFTCLSCLNWLDYYVTPHADEKGRIDSSIMHLKNNKRKGILLSNCCALEIVDDNYKIIKSSKEAFAYLMFWENNKLYKKELLTEGKLLDVVSNY
jgi:dipeptidase E